MSDETAVPRDVWVRALLRGVAVGAVNVAVLVPVTVVWAGTGASFYDVVFVLLLGLVAAPLVLVEHRARASERVWPWVFGCALLAVLGFVMAWIQMTYVTELARLGSLAGALEVLLLEGRDLLAMGAEVGCSAYIDGMYSGSPTKAAQGAGQLFVSDDSGGAAVRRCHFDEQPTPRTLPADSAAISSALCGVGADAAVVGAGAVLLHCVLTAGSSVGKGSLLSGVADVWPKRFRDGIAAFAVRLSDRRSVLLAHGVDDDLDRRRI